MNLTLMMSYAVGPTLLEACESKVCCVCGKPKDEPKPVCDACYFQPRPDRMPFKQIVGDLINKPLLRAELEAKWNQWIGAVIAAQN